MPADPADAGDAEDVDGEGAPQGLSWSYELDFGALIAALAGVDPPGAADTDAANAADAADAAGGSGAGTPAPGSVEEEAAQEAILDELAELDARAAAEGRVDGGRVPLSAVAGRVAERLAPGPDLAAWLATASPAGLDDGDLAAVAGSWRRVASWAQARELAAVAQLTSRAAARDEHAGINCDGRPSQVTASAAAEVALELTMSQYSASAWADLAVQLSWPLAATGAALDKGVIDVSRARLIAEATGMLSDETARAVEERVLPAAGGQTTGMLRAALRRAVIAADPSGAEERRKDAERRAQVVLYPDQDCTATLAGQRLPAIHAAAAMARITAMAWAMKASGAGGGIDLLRAQVFVGLLLGTMPVIPPAEGAPPDNPPSGDPPSGDPPPGGPSGSYGPPGDAGSGPRDDSGSGSDDDSGVDQPSDGRRHGALPEDGVASDVPPPGDQDAPRPEDDYPCPDSGPARGSRPGYSDGDHDDGGWTIPEDMLTHPRPGRNQEQTRICPTGSCAGSSRPPPLPWPARGSPRPLMPRPSGLESGPPG
jgi:Domain of unknown function (DUF222)